MPSRRSKTVLGGVGVGVLLAASAVTVGGGVASAATPCPTTASTVVPGIRIQDPSCDFVAEPGASAYTGILHGSAYRIEVPDDWNGRLVMYAHGYAGTGDVVSVSDPQLRDFYIRHGYAWAASSYRQNGYDVGDGVVDTHDLRAAFPELAGRGAPRETYMTGVSMGGEITAVEIERYRGEFEAAMPTCGVLGANHLFDYFLGANATAFALTDTALQYPTTAAAGAAYTPTFDRAVHQQVMPGLGIAAKPDGTSFTPTFATQAGQEWVRAVEQLSGGTRPGFPGALQYWSSFGFGALGDVPFLFGVYPGLTGGTIGYADGNVADNHRTVYQLDDRRKLTDEERALNAAVIRVRSTNTHTTDPTRTELPDITGDPGIPVLSLHDIGDLFVPLKMDQLYAERVNASGRDLFVDRAIRGTGHCEFSDSELASGFADLVAWAHSGHRAAGDDIFDADDASFGCRFTDSAYKHVWFGGRCPAGRSDT